MSIPLIDLPALRAWIPRGGKVPQSSFDSRHRVICGVIVVHVLVLAVVASVLHDSPVAFFSWFAAIAILAGAGLLLRGRRTRSSASSLALLCCAAALVELTAGSITSHFDFFVVLAFVAMYQEWAPYLLSVLFTAVHHVVMGFFMPMMVFGDPVLSRRPVLWAFIHAAFVLAACVAGVLCWGLSERAQDDAVAAQATAAEAIEAQRAAQEAAAQHQHELAQRALDAAAAADLSATAARELSEQLSNDAADAGGRVTEVSSGLYQLHGSITEIAGAAARASRAGREASRQAAVVNTDVAALTKSAEQIGEVVALITTIAAQTKLLSLNAVIEAARAGQSGAGFSVVADEVKALAGETARATEVIIRVVEELQLTTVGAVSGLATITGNLAAIEEISAEIAGATEEQRITSAGINTALGEAAAAVSAISTATGGRLTSV